MSSFTSGKTRRSAVASTCEHECRISSSGVIAMMCMCFGPAYDCRAGRDRGPRKRLHVNATVAVRCHAVGKWTALATTVPILPSPALALG
jgi:hypothetical protein